MSRVSATLLLCLACCSLPAVSLELTTEERAWLTLHPELRLGVDRDWPPYEFIDNDEQYRGLAADYVRLIEERLAISLRPAPAQNWSAVLADARTGKVQLLPSLMATPEREQYLTFTRPYIDFPIVILTHEQGPQPRELRELQGLRVAVVDSYATHELLRDKHPELRLWPRPSVAAALQALASGEADAMVGDLASGVWHLRQLKLDGIVISGQTPYRYQLAMAVPKDQAILAGILDKLLAELTPGEIADIQQRWGGELLDQRSFWRSVLLFGLPGLLAALLIIFSILRINHRLRSEMHSRALLEGELRNSEQHYRGLVESLNAVAWQMDPSEFRYTYVAPQVERLLGYPAEDWLQPGFIERALHPDDARRTLDYCRSETQAGRDHSMDYRMLAADGHEVWVRDIVTLSPQADAQMLRGLLIDITETKRTEQALALSEDKFAKAFHASPDGLLITRLSDGQLLNVNEGFSRITGYSLNEATDSSTLQLGIWANPDDRIQMFDQVQQHGSVRDFRALIRTRDGSLRTCEMSAQPIPIAGDTCMLTIARDITEREQMQEHLKHAATVFESTAEGVMITDLQQRITAVNRAFTSITGYSEAEALGQSPRLLSSGHHDSAFYAAMWHNLNASGHWQGEIWNKRKNGELYPEWLTISAVRDSDQQITHFVGVFADISSLKHAQANLDHQAHHDPLTGLPNRMLFEARLHAALEDARLDKRMDAVLFIDLDRFKHINDSLGHPVGDQLLKSIATRLKSHLRDIDTVARLGGDEFIILLPGLQQDDDAELVANKLLDCFSLPFQFDEQELFISASIGISRYPDDGDDVATLVKNADAAMYRSKARGRNRVELYTRDLTFQATERMALERELRRAIELEQLQLYYQPKRSLSSNRLIGAEALLRWHHPVFGEIPPDRFIPLAEETGLIISLGDWVLRQACWQMQQWLEQHAPFGPLSVNLTGVQLRQPHLLARISSLLEDHNLAPALLQLEITESFIMNQAEEALRLLHQLKSLGIQLAIDDFGTGYSSLSYLKRLPVDTLKIDQSFVRGLPGDGNDVAIVRAIIALGRSMQLTVIAEGVETTAQELFLAAEGCEQIQGFVISRPIPADTFAEKFLTPLHSVGAAEKAPV
jgi:diguanylate cyclase (GGDEF)-like protein/PAS domain S-box-containing protein